MPAARRAPDIPPNARPVLLGLSLIGLASAAWAAHLWWQLLRSRSGLEPVCAFGGSDCGTLWDAGFASALHGATGLPVAAWGVLWGLLAMALAWWARRDPNAPGRLGAVRWTAAAGAAALGVLLIASAVAGLFCSSCALTYILVAVYAALTGLSLRGPLDGAGLKLAALFTGAGFLALLLPGLRTPTSAPGSEPLVADAEDTRDQGEETAGSGTDEDLKIDTWPLPADEQDRRLREFLGAMDARGLQYMSDALAFYRAGEQHPMDPHRGLHGEPGATTQLADWSDARCGHCAQLHFTLNTLFRLFPEGALGVDVRHFPRDGHCNPHMETPEGGETVSCLAARVQICLETVPGRHDFADRMYEAQGDLTPGRIRELAAPFLSAGELDACLASPATAEALRQDIEYAWRWRPKGTPLLVLDGRPIPTAPPFLYALVLAGGNADHPAFADLPPAGPTKG
ncbi:MAG: vitamin K epoxide reductase family protein [Acidobacteriota bacterium]